MAYNLKEHEHARRAIKTLKVKRYVEGTGEHARDVEQIEITSWDKVAGTGRGVRPTPLGRG